MAKRIPRMDEIFAVAATHGANSEAPHLWKDLVGAWPMQEGEGYRVYDVSGRGNHGMRSAWTPPVWCNTEIGKAAYFINRHSIVTINPCILPESPVRTLAVWMIADVGIVQFRLSLYGSDGTNATRMGKYSTYLNPFYHYGNNDDTLGYAHITDFVLSTTDWNFLAGVYQPGFVRGFVSGWGAKDANTYHGVRPTILKAVTSAEIGGSYTTNAHVWHRALPDSELWELYEDPWAMYRIRPKVFRVAIIEAPPAVQIFSRRQFGPRIGTRQVQV